MKTPIVLLKEDFTGYVDISSQMDYTKKIVPCVQSALDFNLRAELGDSFYYWFLSFFNADGTLKDDAPAAVTALFEGGNYEVKGINWVNPGLKVVLIYFSAMRIVRTLDMHITPNAIMFKTNEFSEHAPGGVKSFAANDMENKAIAELERVRTFIRTKKEDYPVYFSDGCGCDGPGPGRIRAKRFAVGGRNC